MIYRNGILCPGCITAAIASAYQITFIDGSWECYGSRAGIGRKNSKWDYEVEEELFEDIYSAASCDSLTNHEIAGTIRPADFKFARGPWVAWWLEHRTPDRKAWVRCPMAPNTLRVHKEYVLVKSVGPKVLWAESRVQGSGEYFPPLQCHGKLLEVEIGGVAIYHPYGEFRRDN
ncbi:uncharacterized protein TNCV_3962301 [Trichonephila clavipes]|nr:uncharacterized protein TNCV_3962301 [Trichonephila clavipes]